MAIFLTVGRASRLKIGQIRFASVINVVRMSMLILWIAGDPATAQPAAQSNFFYLGGDDLSVFNHVVMKDGEDHGPLFEIHLFALNSFCAGTLTIGSTDIVEGSLPSGMTLEPGSHSIVGNPHGAGTYHVRIRISGLACNGIPKPDEYSDVKFDIAAAPGAVAQTPIVQSNFFTHAFYTPATGKVGYHLSSEPRFYVNDIPNQCTPAWTGIEISSGTLPPGLNPPVVGAPGAPAGIIEGTPTQPGDWQFIVTLHHVSCYNGADHSDYGDKTISVQFHVDGDAPRGVN